MSSWDQEHSYAAQLSGRPASPSSRLAPAQWCGPPYAVSPAVTAVRTITLAPEVGLRVLSVTLEGEPIPPDPLRVFEFRQASAISVCQVAVVRRRGHGNTTRVTFGASERYRVIGLVSARLSGHAS